MPPPPGPRDKLAQEHTVALCTPDTALPPHSHDTPDPQPAGQGLWSSFLYTLYLQHLFNGNRSDKAGGVPGIQRLALPGRKLEKLV